MADLNYLEQNFNYKDYNVPKTWGNLNFEDTTPAILFANSTNNNKFGEIYLFSDFGISESNSLAINSDITVHYTEENNTLNDHWAVQPLQYTLRGLIGEVVYTPPSTFTNFVDTAVGDYLSPIGFLAPTFDTYTSSIINIGQQVEASLTRYIDIAKLALNNIKGTKTQETNQQYVVNTLQNLVLNRQLVTIYTPYGEYSNMAIKTVNISQEKTKFQSSIEITLQQWRNAETITRQATAEEKSFISQVQSATTKEMGQAGTSRIEKSTLKNIFGKK